MNFLEATTAKNSCRRGRGPLKSIVDLGLLQINSDATFIEASEMENGGRHECIDWGLKGKAISFHELPEFAVFNYQWSCTTSPEKLDVEKLWEMLEHEDSQFQQRWDKEKRWENRLSADAFRQLSVREFVHECWLAGATPPEKGLARGGAKAIRKLCKELPQFITFGTDYGSLQEGLTVTLKNTLNELKDDIVHPSNSYIESTKPKPKRKRKDRRRITITKKQREVWELYHVRGWTITKIAAEWGCAVQNISKMLNLADEKIKVNRPRSPKAQRLDVDRRGQETVADQGAEE